MPINQRGFLQIVFLVVIVVAIGAGIYLLQGQQIFKSQAALESQGGLLNVSTDNLKPGDQYTVSWKNVPSETVFDMIALYPKSSSDDNNYSTVFFTSSCSRYAGEKAIKTGSCTLTATNTLVSGEYEWRFFTNAEYSRKLASLPIRVNNTGSPINSGGVTTVPSTPTSSPQSVDLRPVTCTASNAGQTLEGGCTGSCGGCSGGTGQVAMFRCVPSNAGSIASQVQSTCSSRCSQYCPIPTATPIPNSAQAGLTDYCPGGVCNMKAGFSGSCTNGLITFSWPVQDNAKTYLLRIDRDPDSWNNSYTPNPGDLIHDNYNSTFNGRPQFSSQFEKNHNYKVWIHAAYDSSFDNDGHYIGKYGPRIDGGIVTCR
jgi:hypothetical protein